MPFGIGQAAATAANTGLGMLLQGHNNRVQLKQQGKLGRQQLQLNKEMLNYQQQKQLEMWNATNYSAQIDHMKKAGLNPGLAYGMSGGGGLTAGGGAPNVGQPAAAQGQEIMNMQLLGAQKELLEAQTEKTKAEAAKTAGVDTQLAVTQQKIAELERSMLNDTYEVTYHKLTAEMDKAHFEAALAGKTLDTEIKMKQGELLGIGLANELKKEGIKLTEAQTKETVNRIAQKWMDLKLKQGKLDLDKFVNDVAMSTRLTVETASKVVNNLVNMKKGK